MSDTRTLSGRNSRVKCSRVALTWTTDDGTKITWNDAALPLPTRRRAADPDGCAAGHTLKVRPVRLGRREVAGQRLRLLANEVGILLASPQRAVPA